MVQGLSVMNKLLLRSIQPCCAGAASGPYLLPKSSVHTGTKCHYEVLNLTPSATVDEIKEAFIKLSKEVHPDANPGNPKNHDRFVRLNEAYTVLKEPATRKAYDLEKKYGRAVYSQPPQGGAQYDSAYRSTRNVGASWDDPDFYNATRDAGNVPADEYYGFKGYKRRDNTTVLMWCLGFVFVGIIFNSIYFSISHKRVRRHLDEQDRKNRQISREVQEAASANGHQRQLELLRQRLMRGHRHGLQGSKPASQDLEEIKSS